MAKLVFALPVALLYGILIQIRNALYARRILPVHSLPCFVVSVGNLTLGGSGKTPFALFLLEWLSQNGIPAGYLSRGYKRRSRGYHEVDLSQPDPSSRFGDEACLVKMRLPHLPVAVSEDRVKGGKKLLHTYPHLQVLVLDDAFQHRRLHRDIDILIIDSKRPPWKDWLFPLGHLREPPAAIRRAHLLIYNQKTQPQTPLRRRTLQKPSLSFFYEPVELIPAFASHPPLSLAEARYRPALAFCGIATPDSFYQLLRDIPIYTLEKYDFPDHHPFSERNLRFLRHRFKQIQKRGKLSTLLLLTTEKDLARLKGSPLLTLLEGLPLYGLRIAMKPTDPQKAEALLSHLFASLRTYDHTRSL